MKVTGTGTRHSPIAIDDSEDEVVQELFCDTSLDSHTFPLSLADKQETLPPNRTVSSEMSKGNIQQADSEGKRPQKRKRPMNDGGPVAGPSQQRAPVPNTPVLSKQAKKRRRKLERERQLMETEAQAWVENNNYIAPNFPTSAILPSWPTMGGGYPDAGLYPFPGMSGPFPLYDYPELQFTAASPSTSSSPWVASMAMAAGDPANGAWKWTDRGSPHSDRSMHALSAAPRPQNPSEPATSAPPVLAPAHTSTSTHISAAAPSLVPTIGMKPEQDASSKHGLFKIPATTSSKGDGRAYIPNPARTLVMEQLPKSHRNTDWVNAWSKTACGAYPVHSSIDPSAAKALVEFATAELARKAWYSPRLGAALVGLKTHQLKGRPREDLIKVWWYRVDGVGANAGVGELEEGEIEGDAAEKEVEVVVKKETKKERKARLAKERQEKQAALQASKPAAPPVQASDAAIPPYAISGMQGIAPAGTPAALNLTVHSDIPPHAVHSYDSAISPNPVQPHHTVLPLNNVSLKPPFPQRTPLQPQSSLETHWRPKHELPKKPTGIPDISTAHLDTHPQIGLSSSIASSAQGLPPHSMEPSPTATHDTLFPPHEDMDVDDDMELESPQTRKHAHFNISLPPSIVKSTSGGAPVVFAPTPTTSMQPMSTASRNIPVNAEPDRLASAAIESDSPTPSATPPLEPRAMKNAPKGPSFAKRSLMARHKELEDRIARSKLELGIVGPTSDSHLSTTVPSTSITVSPLSGNGGSNKQAMEAHLRSLVLQSQRHRVRTPASVPLSVINTSNAISMSPDSALPSPSSTTVIPGDPSSAVSSLDDLAVSFITETIETIKATPALLTPALVPARVSTPSVVSASSRTISNSAMDSVNTKLALAEKQKRLEAQIAESKFMMEKLARAKTKQERESLLAVMRERSRMMEDLAASATPTSTSIPTPKPPLQTHSPVNANDSNAPGRQAQAVKTWAGSHEHTGVFIVSDDEDDGSDCGAA